MPDQRLPLPYGIALIDGEPAAAQTSLMPKSGDSQTDQIKKLKQMLRENEVAAEQMRTLITEIEQKAHASKEKKRPSDLSDNSP